MALVCSIFGGRLGGMADHGVSPARWFRSSFRLFFSVFGMVRRRSSPPYPRSGGASSTGKGRVELCVRRISWDPVRLCIRWCGYKFGFSDIRFPSLAMVAGPLSWSFGDLARWLSVYLLQQALLLFAKKKLYSEKLCPAMVMDGRGRWHAFGSL
jgi:hypothetical protein